MLPQPAGFTSCPTTSQAAAGRFDVQGSQLRGDWADFAFTYRAMIYGDDRRELDGGAREEHLV